MRLEMRQTARNKLIRVRVVGSPPRGSVSDVLASAHAFPRLTPHMFEIRGSCKLVVVFWGGGSVYTFGSFAGQKSLFEE